MHGEKLHLNHEYWIHLFKETDSANQTFIDES